MNIWVTIASSLVSGIIGVIISTFYYRRYEKRKLKFDTYRRLAGTRFCLTNFAPSASKDEFFKALNEAYIVFHDSKQVIVALENLHKELRVPDRLFDNIAKLFRAINKDLGIKYSDLTDEFVLRPFTPNVQVPVHNQRVQGTAQTPRRP